MGNIIKKLKKEGKLGGKRRTSTSPMGGFSAVDAFGRYKVEEVDINGMKIRVVVERSMTTGEKEVLGVYEGTNEDRSKSYWTIEDKDFYDKLTTKLKER
ncbi:MAG: hypothetical protein ACE5J7_02415 [Candidatus Aenigmatarchaeota archaeon]